MENYSQIKEKHITAIKIAYVTNKRVFNGAGKICNKLKKRSMTDH